MSFHEIILILSIIIDLFLIWVLLRWSRENRKLQALAGLIKERIEPAVKRIRKEEGGGHQPTNCRPLLHPPIMPPAVKSNVKTVRHEVKIVDGESDTHKGSPSDLLSEQERHLWECYDRADNDPHMRDDDKRREAILHEIGCRIALLARGKDERSTKADQEEAEVDGEEVFFCSSVSVLIDGEEVAEKIEAEKERLGILTMGPDGEKFKSEPPIHIRIERFYFEGNNYNLDPPLDALAIWDPEAESYWLEVEGLGLNVYADDENVLLERVMVVLAHNWETYTKVSEGRLAPKALELRGRLLKRLTISEQPFAQNE